MKTPKKANTRRSKKQKIAEGELKVNYEIKPLFDKQFRTHIGKATMLDALAACHAVVSTACEVSGVGRTTFYQWLKEDPEFKEAAESCKERALDFTESKLFQLIDGFEEKIDRSYVNAKGKKITRIITKKHPPDSTAVIFHLQTQGKSRGYIKTTELAFPEQVTKISLTRKVINSKEDLK